MKSARGPWRRNCHRKSRRWQASDGHGDAIDVALAGHLQRAVCDVFLFTAEAEGLAEVIPLRAEFRILGAALLCLAIGEAAEAQGAADAEALRQFRVEIELAAVPQAPAE